MTSKWPPDSPLRDEVVADLEPAGTPTPTPPIQIGDVVAGKYRIDGVIGFGGMGIVCAATHLELGSRIAIKFVRPEHGSDERAVARFLTEARAAAGLQSQYACRVMDVGRLPSGSPYIVMEHLSGQNLQTRLEALGPMDFHDVATLALQVCEALAEAHSKHLVHRDIKPENLFIAEGPGGSPLLKVLDFGISKQVSPLTTPRPATDSMESVGSPFHMSPEQMTDPGSVDSRSDIWSLGVVMYELLTGQLPFAGHTAPQLCVNVMTTQPIPPQAHRAEIPDGLTRIVLRCLDKDRDRRFKDVGELAQALTEYAGPAGVMAAERVERILGRTPSETAPPTALDTETARPLPDPSPTHPVAIAGVPRRGLGVRVGVGVVLIAATGLAAVAVHQSFSPTPTPQPSTAPAAAPPASAASLEPAASTAAPSATTQPNKTRAKSKRPKRASAPQPSPERAPVAPPAGTTAATATPDSAAPDSPAPPDSPIEPESVTPPGSDPTAPPLPTETAPDAPAPQPGHPTDPPADDPPASRPTPAPGSTVVYPKIPIIPSIPAP